MMKPYEIKYIELKTGYCDNGPAWIGKVKISKTGSTIYFNNKAFKKCTEACGNFYDVETNDIYWISGVKKDGKDRHRFGNGKIMIDRKIIDEYLEITGKTELEKSKFEIIDLEDIFPVDRINRLFNETEEEKRV